MLQLSSSAVQGAGAVELPGPALGSLDLLMGVVLL